jgi:competence protein ComEA
MPAAKIHLSTATAEQLDEIDGIGPTLAERIIEYRDAHGGFRSIDELSEVDGIGETRLTALRDALQP